MPTETKHKTKHKTKQRNKTKKQPKQKQTQNTKTAKQTKKGRVISSSVHDVGHLKKGDSIVWMGVILRIGMAVKQNKTHRQRSQKPPIQNSVR